MTNKLKIICSLLLSLVFLTGNGFSQTAPSKFWFTVTDENGSFIGGLKSADFQIKENKNTLPLNDFRTLTDSPLEVVFMIDASTSQEMVLPFEKAAAENFIDAILKPERDKVGVVKFTGAISLEQDLTSDFRKAKEQIARIKFDAPQGKLGNTAVRPGRVRGSGDTLPPGVVLNPPDLKKSNDPNVVKGASSIFDSTIKIIETFSKINASTGRRIIVLISDGVNTYGEGKLKDVVEASTKNQIPIYAIGIGDWRFDGVDEMTLKRLTSQTGGSLVMPKETNEEIQKQIRQLEPRLRSFYGISFTPDSAAGKDSLREAKIEIVNPELKKKKLRVVQPKGFVVAQ